ncbi:MAG: cell division protein ZipA [Gammaproteobacteria bacterium]|nr:cell division protein ZipA [Gammaproteobacteria bacterium]
MDAFRWILLAIGIAVVVAVYFWGRSRRREIDIPPLKSSRDLPSVKLDDDGWVDGVGPVRVVQRSSVEAPVTSFSCDSDSLDDDVEDTALDTVQQQQAASTETETITPVEQPPVVDGATDVTTSTEAVEPAATPEITDEEPAYENDVVVLYIVAPRGSELKGEQILSSTCVTRLQYGEMKIFHRKDEAGDTEFSMANMMEPGWFDSENMHLMTTRGVSLFMQLGLCKNPVKSLDEMLLCAHTMSGMLGAQICDQNRQLLNETYTRALRAKASHFAGQKSCQSA